MSNLTQYKKLTLPLSTEVYDVEIFNNNAKIIDEELHKLDEKNQSQDSLLATKQELNTHTNNQSNPHKVTKSQVGLGNVDNTSDIDKPVSNDQQVAINDAYNNSISYTDMQIKNLSIGSIAHYKGYNDNGEISGDLTQYNVTSDMTLKELFSAIPNVSIWEIYFNSHENNLNHDMPVQTGGILHIYKATSDRGMIYFFDYRTGDIYTCTVINNIFQWSSIQRTPTETNLFMYMHPSQINSSYSWKNFDISKMSYPAILCAVINSNDCADAFSSGIIPINEVGNLVIFAPATRVSAIFISGKTQLMYHASANNITTENLIWSLSATSNISDLSDMQYSYDYDALNQTINDMSEKLEVLEQRIVELEK